MESMIEQTFERRKAVVVGADSAAPPAAVWALLADPARWPAWSPHIRRADGRRGSVQEGDELVVRSYGPLAVRTRITRVDPGRRWDFRVLTVPRPWVLEAAHAVVARDGGARVVVATRVRGPGAPLLALTALNAYRPLAALAVRRLARLAQEG
jgi:uncharacterized protein YndB with AHSA1/START domain